MSCRALAVNIPSHSLTYMLLLQGDIFYDSLTSRFRMNTCAVTPLLTGSINLHGKSGEVFLPGMSWRELTGSQSP